MKQAVTERIFDTLEDLEAAQRGTTDCHRDKNRLTVIVWAKRLCRSGKLNRSMPVLLPVSASLASATPFEICMQRTYNLRRDDDVDGYNEQTRAILHQLLVILRRTLLVWYPASGESVSLLIVAKELEKTGIRAGIRQKHV